MWHHWFIIISYLIVRSNSQITTTPNNLSCTRDLTNKILTFFCPKGSTIDKLDIDDFEYSILNNIETLQVIGMDPRGPLTTIPTNICRLKNLKHLDLSNNQIQNATFDFNSSCLSQLENLDLSNNFLIEIPIKWISQMFILKIINLSNNKLYCIPYEMFYNISNIEIFDVSSNNLISFELWLIQIKTLINYSNNRITHFSNDYNIDLSNKQINITQNIILNNTKTKISFDDSILIMYNRCQEINLLDNKILMETIKIIHESNRGLLDWRCSCEQYYLIEYIVKSNLANDFLTWKCDYTQNITYRQKCNEQSSVNFMNTKPRLCKFNESEPGLVPVKVESDLCDSNFLTNDSDLESISLKIYNKLIMFNLLNDRMIYQFSNIIDRANNKLNQIPPQTTTQTIRNNFQNIISYIEQTLQSINITINISINSVSILSLVKTNMIYSYSQLKQIDSSLSYSTEINNNNSIASITIDKQSIDNLSNTDIYTFYYLPSSIYQYTQEDEKKRLVSPIVGVHLPKTPPRYVNMSFIDDKHQNGTYSCEFWDGNGWNDTGCYYSKGSKSNEHICFCNHTTSFGLFFIPHKMIGEAHIPSIIISCFSILCFCISIILSIKRQTISFRHLSIANVFSLLNSLFLFILLTIILIYGYQLSNKNLKIQDKKCSISLQNLSITTYFFLILSFASKTFLGICYFLTIFFHFISIQSISISNKWFYLSFLCIILISIIPIIILCIGLNQSKSLFLLYDNICWFNSSVVFQFVSIPIIIFISLNLLTIFGITIRLCQFCITRKIKQINEKRIIVSIMIWISLCISLGISWIFGPFLDIMIQEKTGSSSKILQWIFNFFIGLEGVWVLIINISFYLNQKRNIQNSRTVINKFNKYQF